MDDSSPTLPEEALTPVMAHVLFTDIVGYSKLTADEQSAALRRLQEAVRGSKEFARAQQANQLIRNPTGDGMALVFFDDALAPIRCATEIAKQLAANSGFGLRMGLHSGLVYRTTDINGKENVVGEGINTAQRVMDCGDASHIMVSNTQAQFLGSLDRWKSQLQDLGTAEVKHGLKLHVFNLHGDNIGNPALPRKLAESRNGVPAGTQREASVAEPQTSVTGLRVAIIYKREQEPDEELLRHLEREFRRAGCSVFIDRHLTVGLDWAREIEQTLRDADAVIPLLSPASVQSEMLTFEIQIAEEALQRSGKPRILPVRVAWEGPLPPSLSTILARYQYVLWRNRDDDQPLVSALLQGLQRDPATSPAARNRQLDPPGGAVPLNSRFYIERSTDEECLTAVMRQDSIVLVEGARQMGKTSLISRVLREARKTETRVVFTDLQKFNSSNLTTLDEFYRTLGGALADQLDLDKFPEDIWRSQRSPNQNFERYVRHEVLGKTSQGMIWALDEVDRLFTCPFGSEVFGLFRSWHNARAVDPEGPWGILTLLIAYATEAHLFITDLNQSPFNVGTRVRLSDFSLAEVTELNRRYGDPLQGTSNLELFHRLLGGHPYLVRRGLHELVSRGFTIEQLVDSAASDEGPFGDHLRRFLVLLTRDETLLASIRQLLSGQSITDQKLFHRLRAAGLLRGSRAQDAQFRCEIYAIYLKHHLA